MKNSLLFVALLSTSYNLSAQETNGLLFDGADDQVILDGSQNINLNSDNFTFEVVCKADFQQLQFPVLLSNRENTNQGFILGLYGSYDGSGRLWTQINGTNYPVSTGGINLMDNSCHHIALTRSSDSLRYYVDGVKVFSRSAVLGTIGNNHPFWVGNDEPTTTTQFNGVIKEVRIWNQTRSDQEIATYASNQLQGIETGIVGYWRFDEGAGQSVDDETVAGNNGFLGSSSSIDAFDPTWTSDCAIDYSTASLEEIQNGTQKELVKIVDLLGRETTLKQNTPLIKVFSDGSTEQFIEVNF